MKAPVSHPCFVEAPARARFWPATARAPFAELATERIELISRGDLVSGLRLRSPASEASTGKASTGLLLLVHDAAQEAHGTQWSPVARWIARSPRTVAVALDLPLHGPRASAKLSERLVQAFAVRARGADLDRNGAVLVEEFLRQSVHDLGRTLDALLAAGDVDPKRIALLGLGLGAHVADAWLAQERRPSAAVLVRTPRAPGRPAEPPPGTKGAGSPDRLEIDLQAGRGDWAEEAERFLDSRIGL